MMQLIFLYRVVVYMSLLQCIILYVCRLLNPDFVLVIIIITSLCQVCVATEANYSVEFTIETDHHLPHNRPDIVYVSSRNHIYLIDAAVPGDGLKFQEKLRRCRSNQQLWYPSFYRSIGTHSNFTYKLFELLGLNNYSVKDEEECTVKFNSHY